MKRFLKFLCIAIIPVMAACFFLAGCKNCKGEDADVSVVGVLYDKDVQPTQTAVYEADTTAAYNEYKAVLDANGGDVNNTAVIKAAGNAAAKMFVYASYNERELDKYVYFCNQPGKTELSGTTRVTRQDYFLRINKQEGVTEGYRFHQTVKKVHKIAAVLSGFKSKFEQGRIRLTDKTNLLYRFEIYNTKSIKFVDVNDPTAEGGKRQLLTGDWKTGEDWGVENTEMVKSPHLDASEIHDDIINYGAETLRCTVDLLLENVAKGGTIEYDAAKHQYKITLNIDTDVANADNDVSRAMLHDSTGASDVKWKSEGDQTDLLNSDTGLKLEFVLWENGLFRSYKITERWKGKMYSFSGTGETESTVDYSYSDRDCDMTVHLQMLEKAKESVANS